MIKNVDGIMFEAVDAHTITKIARNKIIDDILKGILSTGKKRLHEKDIKKYPDKPWTNYQWAKILLKKGDLEFALSFAEKAKGDNNNDYYQLIFEYY